MLRNQSGVKLTPSNELFLEVCLSRLLGAASAKGTNARETQSRARETCDEERKAEWRNEGAAEVWWKWKQKTACSGRTKRKVGWRQMGKEGSVGEGISQVAGSPAFLPQHTGVCFTCSSLAMHLGPNGERLSQWTRVSITPEKMNIFLDSSSCRPKTRAQSSVSYVKQEPFCFANAPRPRESQKSRFSYLGFISL